MKTFLHRFLCMAIITPLFASCGLIEFEIDESAQQAYDMHIESDTLHVMKGESFRLSVSFTPDSVSNHEVFWQTEHDSIIFIYGNDLMAVGEGDTHISAISVQDRIADTCFVRVFSPWEIDSHEYPYDMVLYADVKVGGKVPTDSMLVGAFVGSEFRGIGRWQQVGDVKFMTFRLYSHFEGYNPEAGERCRFVLYDRHRHTLRNFPQRIDFDGETHGSPGNLFELHLP